MLKELEDLTGLKIDRKMFILPDLHFIAALDHLTNPLICDWVLD